MYPVKRAFKAFTLGAKQKIVCVSDCLATGTG